MAHASSFAQPLQASCSTQPPFRRPLPSAASPLPPQSRTSGSARSLTQAQLHSSRVASCAAASTSCVSPLVVLDKTEWRRTRVCCAAQRKQQPQRAGRAAQQEEDSEEEDGFLDDDFDDDEDDGFFSDEGEEGDGDPLGLEADESVPGVATGGEMWADTALEAARRVLGDMEDLELYIFRAVPGRKLDIRLDRLTDTYGSPSIDDIERFSRMFYQQLIASLGEEAASEISLEVSSPGAERTLALPQDLDRFGMLPLRVEYRDAAGANLNQALQLESYDRASGMTLWRLAEVKANAPGKGRGMNKRQREARFEIPLDSIFRVRVFVDF